MCLRVSGLASPNFIPPNCVRVDRINQDKDSCSDSLFMVTARSLVMSLISYSATDRSAKAFNINVFRPVLIFTS